MRMFNTTISTEHLIIRQVLYLASLRSVRFYFITNYLVKYTVKFLDIFVLTNFRKKIEASPSLRM